MKCRPASRMPCAWMRVHFTEAYIKTLPRVRLELTTSAWLIASSTDYKYGALTDCATGAHTVSHGVTVDLLLLAEASACILGLSAFQFHRSGSSDADVPSLRAPLNPTQKYMRSSRRRQVCSSSVAAHPAKHKHNCTTTTTTNARTHARTHAPKYD